jgi:hypothetical protein
MNCVIGLCARDVCWPSTLADLGYQVQLIEQTIRTGSGDDVKPDMIAVSDVLVHSLVFECKGGISLDAGQISRYKGLRVGDLTRWVTLRTANGPLTFDLCFAVREETELIFLGQTDPYPVLSFGENAIKKRRDFSRTELNGRFIEAIDLSGMRPPLNYYPFSDQDKDAVIIPRVLRMIMQIALKSSKGGPSALVDSTFDSEDILSGTHVYWKALSTEHRTELGNRIRGIVRRILASHEDLRSQLEELESKRGYKIRGPLTNLRTTMEAIVDECEKQEIMNRYV